MDSYDDYLSTTTLREFLDAGGTLTWSPTNNVYILHGDSGHAV